MEKQSSLTGYYKLFEFSYNGITDTQKCKSDYYHHQAKSSHLFLSHPSPKVQLLYKKMQGKSVARSNAWKDTWRRSSFERVIKTKDGGTQIHFIKGEGGCACTEVHLMQRNKTVPNNALLARRTKITPTSEKPHPFPTDFSLLTCALGQRDCQESSSTPQFKSINSSALIFLHSPTLTSIHDHWNYM